MKKVNFDNDRCKTEFWNQSKDHVINEYDFDYNASEPSVMEHDVSYPNDNISDMSEMCSNSSTVARPKRLIKPPGYLKDYVT